MKKYLYILLASLLSFSFNSCEEDIYSSPVSEPPSKLHYNAKRTDTGYVIYSGGSSSASDIVYNVKHTNAGYVIYSGGSSSASDIIYTISTFTNSFLIYKV